MVTIHPNRQQIDEHFVIEYLKSIKSTPSQKDCLSVKQELSLMIVSKLTGNSSIYWTILRKHLKLSLVEIKIRDIPGQRYTKDNHGSIIPFIFILSLCTHFYISLDWSGRITFTVRRLQWQKPVPGVKMETFMTCWLLWLAFKLSEFSKVVKKHTIMR